MAPNASILKSQLLTSGLSQSNPALFQIINQLIDGLQVSLNAAAIINGGGVPFGSQTFITESDESASLPNSFQLIAGTNIQLSAQANKLVISAINGGSIINGIAGRDSQDNEAVRLIGQQGPRGLQGIPGPTSFIPPHECCDSALIRFPLGQIDLASGVYGVLGIEHIPAGVALLDADQDFTGINRFIASANAPLSVESDLAGDGVTFSVKNTGSPGASSRIKVGGLYNEAHGLQLRFEHDTGFAVINNYDGALQLSDAVGPGIVIDQGFLGIGISPVASPLAILDLPTSSAGLNMWDVYSVAGVLNIV